MKTTAWTNLQDDTPEYYSHIEFQLKDGEVHEGYYEPMFEINDDGPWFSEGNLLFPFNSVQCWRYLN